MIVNHALLASSINKQNSFLCEDSVCIVDEAHKLTENCREQLRVTINNSIFKSIFDSFISIYTKVDHYKIDKTELKDQFNKLKHDFESFMKDFNDFMQRLCIELIENTSEEILEITKEMNKKLDGTWVADPIDNELQKAYQALFKRDNHIHGFTAHIGAVFLRQNQNLIN